LGYQGTGLLVQATHPLVPPLIFALLCGHGDIQTFLTLDYSQTFDQKNIVDPQIHKGLSKIAVLIELFSWLRVTDDKV
jgi:hypothetical protein